MTTQIMTPPPRSPTPTLRERQTELTRNAIIDALADAIVEQGLHDFSVQDVADRAGVSHRTVYRHFPDREALLEGLVQKLDSHFRERDLPTLPADASDIVVQIRNALALFAEHRRLVRAVAVGSLSVGRQPRSRRTRDEVFREKVEEVAAGLPPREARQASAVVRYLANSLAWVVLTEQLGLEDDEATDAVSWAVETLLANVRRRAAERRGPDGAAASAPDDPSTPN